VVVETCAKVLGMAPLLPHGGLDSVVPKCKDVSHRGSRL